MSYQLYRNTTIGNTLQESLDELIQVSCILGIMISKCLYLDDCIVHYLLMLIVVAVWANNAGIGYEGTATVRQVHQSGAIQ